MIHFADNQNQLELKSNLTQVADETNRKCMK